MLDFPHGFCTVVLMVFDNTRTTVNDHAQENRNGVPSVHEYGLDGKHRLQRRKGQVCHPHQEEWQRTQTLTGETLVLCHVLHLYGL